MRITERDLTPDGHGETSLFRAHDVDFIRALVAEGADPRHVNHLGHTPMRYVRTREAADALVELGAVRVKAPIYEEFPDFNAKYIRVGMYSFSTVANAERWWRHERRTTMYGCIGLCSVIELIKDEWAYGKRLLPDIPSDGSMPPPGAKWIERNGSVYCGSA